MSLLKLEKTDPSEIREAVKLWAMSLKGNPAVLKAYVFGSFGRGTPNVTSDLDVAVIVDDQVSKPKLKKPLKGVFPVDFVVVSKSEFEQKSSVGGICFSIADEGVEVYPNWTWGERDEL